MKLYVEELRATALSQTITRETPCLVYAVRLHLCKFLSPAGTFIVTITDASDNVLATSSQTLVEMQAAGSADLAENYYHGHVTFAFTRCPTLRADTNYKIKLSSSGYTYSNTVFLGWCKAYDDRAIAITGGVEPTASTDSPYDVEILALEKVR